MSAATSYAESALSHRFDIAAEVEYRFRDEILKILGVEAAAVKKG